MALAVNQLSSVADIAPKRSRSEERGQAILDAAVELLLEIGYERMSMDMLAAKAKASKATIYRHWTCKAEIVAEAIRRRACPVDGQVPDTGSLRGDLLIMVSKTAQSLASEEGALITGLFSAMQSDSELAELIHHQVFEQKRDINARIIESAIERGEARPGTDFQVICEIVPAVIFMRHFMMGEQIDEDFVEYLVDDVLLKILTC